MRASFRSRAVVLVALLAAAAAPGCKRDAEPPAGPAPAGDRTLERLREEVDRAQRGEATGRAPDAVDDPNARLAALAARDDKPRTLALPQDTPTAHLGNLAVKPISLTASNSVRAGRLELTTEEQFLAVVLLAQNVGQGELRADLSLASVRSAGGTDHPIASDAQRGGTRELDRTWAPADRAEVTLYFEVPPAVLGKGLSLVLPAGAVTGGKEDVLIPLDSER